MLTEKEENGETRNGWYKHKDTGAVVHLVNDPELGTPLTNSYIRAGFEFAGETDPREADKARVEAENAKLQAEAEAEAKAEAERAAAEEAMRSRIAEIEAENAKLQAEAAKAKATTVKEDTKTSAK